MDFGTPVTIKTFYMAQSSVSNSGNPNFNVYLGNVANIGTDNTLVYFGGQEGIAVCISISTGQYLIWELLNTSVVNFSELRAYDLVDIGHHADVASSGLSAFGVGRMKPLNLVGTSDGRLDCLYAVVSSKAFTITLSWDNPVDITDIIVFT